MFNHKKIKKVLPKSKGLIKKINVLAWRIKV